jgi:hypothetical protein
MDTTQKTEKVVKCSVMPKPLRPKQMKHYVLPLSVLMACYSAETMDRMAIEYLQQICTFILYQEVPENKKISSTDGHYALCLPDQYSPLLVVVLLEKTQKDYTEHTMDETTVNKLTDFHNVLLQFVHKYVHPADLTAYIFSNLLRIQPSAIPEVVLLTAWVMSNVLLVAHDFECITFSDAKNIQDKFLEDGAHLVGSDTIILDNESLKRFILENVLSDRRSCQSCGMSHKDFSTWSGSDAQMQVCGKCQCVYYCGRPCQISDIGLHSEFCSSNTTETPVE